MCFRAVLAAATLAACTPASLSAQVQSSGLDDVNPWGFGFLTEGEQALPASLWSASRAEDILPLMRRARTRNLTPAERTLLRRVVLSPARKPGGEQDDDLLTERARLIYELGEAAAAARLMPELAKSPSGLNADEVSVDLLLALGQEASACANTTDDTKSGAFWARLRVVCFALQGDTPATELALELAAADGVEDQWFFDAVFAALDETTTPPPARFDSGLNLALSTKGGLKAPINAVASSRPDLAAAMAIREALPADLRVQAAGAAAENGLISADAHRATYAALMELDAFRPRTLLEIAFKANQSDEESVDTRARTLRSALQAAEGNAPRYHAVARLLAADINALPKSEDTEGEALSFARANIAAGNLEAAADWLRAVASSEADNQQTFEIAWLAGLILLANNDDDLDLQTAILERMMAAANGTKRRAAMHRLLALWSAFDLPLIPAARTELAGAPEDDAKALAPLLLRSINAASDAEAAGEAILRILKATSGHPESIRASDMAQIAEALIAVGASDAARQLALESTGFWQKTL